MKFAIYELWNDVERAKLEEASKFHGFEYVATKEVLSMENIHLCEGCDGVSTLGRVCADDALLCALAERGIRYYSTRTIGYNHIDLTAAKKYDIKVCNSSYPPDSVAEFTVMLILLSLRKYKQTLWRQQVNDYSLLGLQGKVLGRMTVGVMGGGRIGMKVMELLKGFGCRILCVDEVRRPEVEALAEYVDEGTMYALSDIITYHVPCFPSTYHILNEDTLSQMKDGIILINTARGELFDIPTLVKGIESEKIGALAMDVFEGEEGIYHENRLVDILKNRDMAYLRQFPNVIFTPHMAFYTQLSMESMMWVGMEGLVEFVKTGHAKNEIIV
ncbi:MAG: lactate dehydrogenase [Clostridia bacterium]|nr:lactate dehydrogenase [Clostridia bacterium]